MVVAILLLATGAVAPLPSLPPMVLEGLRAWGESDFDQRGPRQAVTEAVEDGAPMQKVLFGDDAVNKFGARCLDGSPSGYYYREGSDPDSVVMYLEGGGLCIEPIDCLNRAKGNLGSSKAWSKTASVVAGS